jgi:uncharacterized protein
MKRKGDWIQTFKGKQFWPLDPRAEEVDLEDIAHSLALTCRFGGHCLSFYSVAQHSVLVSRLVNPNQSLAGLIHDGSEAYLVDIPGPVKLSLPGYKEIEQTVDAAILAHFGIDNHDKEEIKYADNLVLFAEMRDVMHEPPQRWKEYEKYSHLVPEETIIPLSPRESERLFLERYEEITESKSNY